MFKQLLHDFIDTLSEDAAKLLHGLLGHIHLFSKKSPAPPVKPAGGSDPDHDGDNDTDHPDETGE